MKKVTSIIIIALLFAVVVQAGGVPAQSMQLRVVADRAAAEPGDTVFFTVVLGSVSEIGSLQMALDIPEGLTYVAGSGSIDSGAKAVMGFDRLDWTEQTLMINGCASAGDYISSGDTTLASFSCTVDSDASGVVCVDLTNVEMGSCQSFGIYTDLFDVVAADVTVTGSAPTQAPTQEETRSPYVRPTYSRPTTAPTQVPTVVPTQLPYVWPTTSPTYTATNKYQIKVVPGKTEVNPGDTVEFNVILGSVDEIGSVQMVLDISAGLSYIEGSGMIVANAQATMGFDSLDWTEQTLMINGCASAHDYTSASDTVIASFRCTVERNASGALSVGLTNVEMGSCQSFGIFTELFNVVAADLTVAGGAPTQAPTQRATYVWPTYSRPTTAPTQTPTVAPTQRATYVWPTYYRPTTAPTEAAAPHEHDLIYTSEVSATENSEGIKAHYVCGGEDGCGKLFEDAFGTVELTEAALIIPKLVPVTAAPTQAATRSPYVWPTYYRPTTAPTQTPTVAPTQRPAYVWPTYSRPTAAPTQAPTQAPISAPVQEPTQAPTQAPTQTPTNNGNYPYNNGGNIWTQWYQTYINFFSGLPWYSNGNTGTTNYGYYFMPYGLSNPFFWISGLF